jgi:hypothetical protein
VTAAKGGEGRTVRVSLADAPTDVLVHLVGLPYDDEGRDVAEIIETVAPSEAVDAATTVVNGLRLLLDLGYAVGARVGERTRFRATTAGRAAVADALLAASPEVSS